MGGFALNTVFCVFLLYFLCIPLVFLCISVKPFRTPDTWQIREEYIGIQRNTIVFLVPLPLYVSYLRIHTQYAQNTQEYIQNT